MVAERGNYEPEPIEEEKPPVTETAEISPSTLSGLGYLSLIGEGEIQTPDSEIARKLYRRQLVLENFETAYASLDTTLLRAHQIDGMDGLYDFLMTANPSDDETGLTKRGALTHAPGAGKSIFAAQASIMFGVGEYLVDDQPPVRVLYLTHDIKGLGQTMGKDEALRGFAKVAPELPTTMVQKGRPFANDPVVGMTYSALRHWYKRHPEAFDDFDVIFADECQEALGPRTKEALEYIMKGKINIALTGSPELEDNRNVYELWPELIHNISLREGVEERGILNSFILYRYKTNEVVHSITKGGEYMPSSYAHLAEDEFLTDQTRQLALLLAGHNIRTTIFAFRGGGSKHAIDLAREINGKTIFDRATGLPRSARAHAIGTFQQRQENNEIFAAFDRGEIDVITTTKMGETAWDPACLNAIILLCPTRSLRAIIQRLGRGARISDLPTIVIHYDYEDRDQKSPYDVFGEPEAQGAIIAPKTATKREPYILAPHQPAKDAGTPLGKLSPQDVRSLDDVAVLSELRHFIDRAEIHSRHRTALYRGSKDVREHGFGPLAPLAESYEIDQIVLAGLLRRNRIKLISFDEGEQRVTYIPEEKVRTFIEEEVAKPQTYHTQQLMDLLGASKKWVTSRVVDDESESKFPRDTIDARRRPHYSHAVYLRLQKEWAETAQEIRDDEISVVELCRKYGTDPTRTVEWFERRGIQATKRKRSDVKNGAAKSGLVCFPRKYEQQFQWHWSAEELPKDQEFVAIAKVFDRSPRLRKMGHNQRISILTALAIQPRRFRTKTNFNYFVSRAEQQRLNKLANATEVVESDDHIPPSASAARVAEQRDKELFVQHLLSNKLGAPEDIAVRIAEPPKQPSSETTKQTAPGASPSRTVRKPPRSAAKRPAVEVPKEVQQPAGPLIEGKLQPWDESEKLATAVSLTRELREYTVTSAQIVQKAQEFNIPLLQRSKDQKTFLCMTQENAAVFLARFKQTVHIDSAVSVGTLLQVPPSFVTDIVVDHFYMANVQGEPDASYTERKIKTATKAGPAVWGKAHEQIVAALRNLHIPRPPHGSVLDEASLLRIRAYLLLVDEPVVKRIIGNAVAFEWQNKNHTAPDAI